MKQPDYVTLRAPCGAVTKVHPYVAEARKAQLEKDHAEGRGCPSCQPASTAQPPKDHGSSLLDHGSSLLDHGKSDKNE
jgi:hypothetical protein